jgi:hypothetical protein
LTPPWRYHGRQEEDPHTSVLVNVWDTLDHHNSFTSSSPLSLLKLPDKGFSIIHAHLTSHFLPALEAPATEFVTISIKPGHAMSELDPLIAKLTEELKEGVVKGSHGSSWGYSWEKPDAVIGLVGWDSVEVCRYG